MTTYYVCPSTGSDVNAGTSFGSGNAWATTQKAFDTAVGGDVVYLCNEAAEAPTATIDIDTNNGSGDSWIVFEGRDGTDGSTRDTYTIRATATWGGGALINRANGFGDGMKFQNIDFDANDLATNAFDDNDTGTYPAGANNIYADCRFRQGTGDGYSNSAAGAHVFYGCEFDNNGGDGYASAATSDGILNAFHCSFHDNTAHGLYLDDSNSVISHCEFYDNGGDGLHLDLTADSAIVVHCTMEGNTGSGVETADNADDIVMVGCTLVSNGDYGFKQGTAGDTAILQFADYNHTHNNTTAATNRTGGLPGGYNQTGDPSFVSVTDGSEDYEPSSDSSPLHENGVNLYNIGARKTAGGAAVVTYVSMLTVLGVGSWAVFSFMPTIIKLLGAG